MTGQPRASGPSDSVPSISPSVPCDYCGLPVFGATPADDAPHYCCSGCRFAASIVAAQGSEGAARWAMTRLGLAVFFAMNVMVFTLLLWSQPESNADRVVAVWYDLARYATLLFSTPVLLLLGGPLFTDAWTELRRGRPSLSLLLVVGIAAAFGYSLVSVLLGAGHVYFEVACTILVAVTLGRWFEASGKLQTTAALRGLKQLLPATVRLVDGANVRTVPAEALQVCDIFRVLPGERIAADGVIVTHEAALDEQAITGESLPVVRRPGDRVLSGALVLDGPLEISAAAPAGAGQLARMIEAVTKATAARTHYERLAERISRWFLPVVAVIAALTLALHAWNGNLAGGLLAALAVLVIACPCALGLATPMALWAAVGRAAEAGVLVRSGDSLALLAATKTIGLDKTGTLTTGTAEATAFEVGTNTEYGAALAVAAALAGASTHPLAEAVARLAEKTLEHRTLPAVTHARVLPGRGIMGNVAGITGPAYLGSLRWLDECGQENPFPRSVPDDAETAQTFLAWGGQVRGAFSMQETVRPETGPALQELRALGLAPLMLTGDRRGRAAALAQELALDFRAELLPEAKLAALAALKAAGPVAMVGDGVNDAPALAAADVGIALGGGADISRHSAGVCLLANDLSRLPWLVQLARQTVRTIRWNLFWAFAYNTAGMALAASGWLHPIFAAIAMGVSSLLVVSNSLVLAKFPLPHDRRRGGSAHTIVAPPATTNATATLEAVP